MASIGTKFNKLPRKRKAYLFVIISFFAFVLIFGIRSAYAYYNDTASLSILANLIGDFDSGEGDVKMMIYTKNEEGIYVRTYAIPAFGYKLENATCSIPCDTDTSSECYYIYDSENKTMSLTSNQKVTCRFYFAAENESDINVFILKEDSEGTYEYNSKKYTLIESVPAYGYKNVYSSCEEGSTIEYNSDTKTFNVSATKKDTCYGYFDAVGNSDLTVNVYVQYAEGSSAYKAVESIPVNNVYQLSTVKTSSCYDDNGTTDTVITYVDGYINIDAYSKQTCDVYLDLVTTEE